MTDILVGQKYWKVGDHRHVWVVDGVEAGTKERPDFVVLVSEDGLNSEDVDLSHLKNRSLYTPVSE